MQAAQPTYNTTEIIFENFQFLNCTHVFILANSTAMPDTGSGRFFTVHPEMIELNVGSFSNPGGGLVFPAVLVQYREDKLILACGCTTGGNKLCTHQTQVLYNIMERPDLRIFFDTALRHQQIRAIAKNYGLQNEPNPDEHFELSWNNKLVSITPRLKSLQPVNEAALLQLAADLLPTTNTPDLTPTIADGTRVLVLSEHKYYKHLQAGL